LLTRGTGKREHARQLCLLSCDILVSRGLDIPLSKTALAIEDRDNVGQVGSRLALLGRWRRAALTVSPGEGILVPVPAAAPAVIELVSVAAAPRKSIVVVAPGVTPGRTTVTIPLPFAAPLSPGIAAGSVPILPLTFAVAAARCVWVFVVATPRVSAVGRSGAAMPVAASVAAAVAAITAIGSVRSVGAVATFTTIVAVAPLMYNVSMRP
jgi:hypothetical protein